MKALAAFLFACTVAGAAVACSSGDKAEPITAPPDEIVSVDQLGGSDMPRGKYVLTFDDGPGPRTEEIANWLGDRGISATFFINGTNAPGRDAALAAIVGRGHTLANHTQNHENMTEQSGDALFRAVADTDAVVARFQPNGPWLLRAPFGAWDGRVADEINATDMSKYVGSVFWNIGGELTETTAADWACWPNGISIQDCADRYLNEIRQRGRGVILMHDIHSNTVDMAKIVVDAVGADHFVSLLTAPQIAANIDQRGDGPRPPRPPAGGGCGSVDFLGRCDANKLTWCENGVLKTADCQATDRVCTWKGKDGHDCVKPQPCGDATFFGACEGDALVWCDETNALRKVSCTAKGKRCALASQEQGFNCIP